MFERLVQLCGSIRPRQKITNDPSKKRENLQLFQQTIHSSENGILNKPLQLFLEITSKCNLRCVKCGMNYDAARLKAQKIPFSFLELMDDFFQTAVEVHTFGYGEMFLYPELPQLVQMLKSHNCRVSGITNGTKIGQKEVSWLVSSRYDQLTFSIDGATQETMKRLRGADLDKILQSLAMLKEEKDRQGSDLPRIVVNFVAQKDNFRELPLLARTLIDLDIYFLGVNALHHFYGGEDTYSKFYREFCLGNAPRDEVEAVIKETRVLAEESGTNFANYIDMDFEWREQSYDPSEPAIVESRGLVNIEPEKIEPEKIEPISIQPTGREPSSIQPSGVEPARMDLVSIQSPGIEPASTLPPRYCLYPWMTLYLAADMTTKVCCYMSAEENLGEFSSASDVSKIWEGPKLTQIRSYISRGRVHPACRVCVEHGSFKSYQAALDGIEDKLDYDSPIDLDPSEQGSDDYPNDKVPPAYEGCHDVANRNVIHGWVWDTRHPSRRIRVEILDGNKLVAVVRADKFRQDLLTEGKADGNCAFTFPVPASLRDGRSHWIRVRVAGTKHDLWETPKQIEGRQGALTLRDTPKRPTDEVGLPGPGAT